MNSNSPAVPVKSSNSSPSMSNSNQFPSTHNRCNTAIRTEVSSNSTVHQFLLHRPNVRQQPPLASNLIANWTLTISFRRNIPKEGISRHHFRQLNSLDKANRRMKFTEKLCGNVGHWNNNNIVSMLKSQENPRKKNIGTIWRWEMGKWFFSFFIQIVLKLHHFHFILTFNFSI